MNRILLTVLIIGLLSACTTDTERSSALVNVFLIDAPGDFDEVWVEVLGVEVHVTGSRRQDNADAVFLPNLQSNQQVNVASLVGDSRFLVGRGEFLVGEIIQLTLSLGDDNHVILDGERFPLEFENPSAASPSVTVSFPLEPGISHDIFIDFEVFRSIRAREDIGNRFLLDPKLRAFSRANTGEISGTLRPQGQRAVLYAIQDQDTVTSTGVQLPSGRFMVRGITGNFTLSILPFDEDFLADTLLNIPVEPRQATQLGDVTLRPKP